MEIQEQIHLKGRVWSPVSYSLEECFDAQAAAERTFPPQVWENTTLGASASSKEDNQEEVPFVPLGKAGSRHTVSLGFCYSWMGDSGSTAGTWAPKVGPIMPERPRPSSRVCSNISIYNCVSKDGAYWVQIQLLASQYTLFNRLQQFNPLGKILWNPNPNTYKNIVAVNMPTYSS